MVYLTFSGRSLSDRFHIDLSIFRQKHALQIYHDAVALENIDTSSLEILALTHKSLRQLVEYGPCVLLSEWGGESAGYLSQRDASQ